MDTGSYMENQMDDQITGGLQTEREIADCYQTMFDFMYSEHNLILTVSEMNEIMIKAEEVKGNLEKLNHP